MSYEHAVSLPNSQPAADDGFAFFTSDEEPQVAFAGESSVQAVPEPGTAALWLGGIAMLLARHRRFTRR
jgi:PEP-CTERM motif